MSKITPAQISNPYKFRARRTTTQASGNGAFAVITFEVEDFDTNSNFSTSTGLYTAPLSGFYQVQGRASANATSQFLIALFKNGSEYQRGTHNVNTSSGANGAAYADVVQLAAGDTIGLYTFGSGANYETGFGAQPFFSGFLVSLT